MSGITGTEARKLMEAYNAVYERNNIKEEFEKWVSELVEEGYDFSEHTWSEVADVYFYLNTENLNEVAVLAAPGIAAGITGLVGGAAKLAQDLQRQRQTRQQEPVDYGQMSPGTVFRAGTHDPASGPKDRTQSAAERLRAQQPTGQQVSAADLEKKAKEAKVRAQQPKPEQPPTPPSTPSQHGARIGRTYPKPEEPKPPKGPNWFQRQLADFQKGRTETKGAGTFQRLGRSYGEGEKLAKGAGEWALKNIIAKPLGAVAGGGLIGGTAYGAYKGSEALVKKFGPGIVRSVRGMINPNLQDSYQYDENEIVFECLNLIANHLIEEKYASNEKEALKIMENMSEGWALNIIENYLVE